MQNAPKIIIGKDFLPAALAEIEQARSTIEIIIYDWRLRPTLPTHPVSLFVRGLQGAASRGVRVRALVGSEVVKDGLRRTGIECKVLRVERIVHAKMMLLDGSKVILGSHNYTQSAFTKNLEISIVAELGPDDHRLQDYFKILWGV